MKKIIFSTIISCSLLFAACEKELDQAPISDASVARFYEKQSDFTQGVNATYASLRAFPDRQLNLSETRSDNLYAVSDGGVRDWEGINSFHRTIASNPYVTEAWSENFNGVFKANTVLDQIEKNGGVIGDESLKTRLQAESRFLRAFFYFDLVRWFGELPIIEKAVLADEANNIGRSPVADVYNFIISDLQFAQENLPEQYQGADRGRATRYAAKALLALVHMTRSGPTYGIKGPGLGLNEWSEALTLLNEIIASGKYSFLTTAGTAANAYANIFSYTNEGNPEVIFDVQYINGSNPVLGATFPWVLVPDTWFQSLGKTTQGGLTIRPVSNDLLNSYEANDVRRNFSVQTGFTFNGSTETRSFFKKYVDITRVPTNNRLDWPINFIVQRYTDILMLKAECILNGAPGTQTEVDAIVNQVRQRAGLVPLSNVTLPQLMEERRKEFAAEGLRWHDLVRSGLVETKIPAWIAAEDVQKQMQSFVKDYIIYPVPQSQLDVRQGLYTQNQGY